ncbi:MAG TPA: RnfABCDGE type electron transport complex subunit D [Acholeplasma sp.]|nr:RnfABCDGE type electron transport complex subunit D [Acholeplasma sp.]
MNYAKQTSPYIRKETSVKRMMVDVLIALLPVVLFAIYRFGWDAVIRILLSVVVMVVAEGIGMMMRVMVHPSVKGFKARFKARFSKLTINNVTAPLVSAIIFALIIPSTLPLYVVAVGAFVGMVIAKLFFGGLGSNVFNPAAVGRVFIGLSFASQFKYVSIDAAVGATPLGAAKDALLNIPNILQNYSLTDLFLGNIPGSMGEISALLIIVGAIYLFVRKAADFRVTLSMILSFSVIIFIGAVAKGSADLLETVLFHVLGGGLLFGAVFMITDPVTSPYTRPGRWIYGLLVGVIAAFIRLFGAYPEGVAFAIIISNMFVALIDYYKWSTNKYSLKFIIGYVVSLAALGLIAFIGMGGIN